MISFAPGGAGLEPDRERLRKILIRMALSVIEPQVLYVAPAGGVGTVGFGIDL